MTDATPSSWPGAERRHRALTEDDAEAIAQHMTQKLIERLSDERVAEQVMAAWSGHLDKLIGKGVRRLLLYLGLVLIGLAAVKFDLFSRLFR